MLGKLTNELDLLESKRKAHCQQIDNLYIQFEEINQRKQFLSTPFLPKKNLFGTVRPEVIYQISEFLNLKEFVQLRLVNKEVNKIVKQIYPQKQEQLQQQVKTLETNLEAITVEAAQNLQAEEQQLRKQMQDSQQQLQLLNKASITELKSLACPPQLVEQVCYFVMILLGQDVNEKQSKWKESQKMLNNIQFIQMLINIDVSSITEQQLAKVAPIDQITMEEMRRVSAAAAQFYSYAKAIVDIRRSKLYITKFKIEDIKKQIAKKHSQIDHIQKVLAK